MKQNTFLKVMSIIMLIGGILGAIISVIPALLSIVSAMAGLKLIYTIFLILATVLSILGAVLQIIAGVKGLGACKDPEKTPACFKLGIIIIGLCILSNLLNLLLPNGSLDITGLLLNLIVPGLYVYSAKQ